jgi:hypothetical protein
VTEIDRDRPVELLRRHVGEGLTLVVGGVVDQRRCRPELSPRLGNRCYELVGAGDVAAEEKRRVAHRSGQRFRQDLSCLFLKVEKATRAPLSAKARTNASPIPLAPPLTSTTRSPRLWYFVKLIRSAVPVFFVHGVSLQFMFLFNAASVLANASP